MKCWACNEKIENDLYREFELKKDKSKVNVCVVCENDGLMYFDKIKRYCLIDGESYEVTKKDEKYITAEKKLKAEQEENDRLMNCDKSIFYFTNRVGKSLEKLEVNHQVIRYCNDFLGLEREDEDHILRFKFPYSINRVWKIDFDNLGEIIITLSSYKKETEKVRKPGEKEWKERIRTWYSGTIDVPLEPFYNATFGFATYSNHGDMVNDVYVNYDFICSKSYKLKRLIMKLLKEDGWNVKE